MTFHIVGQPQIGSPKGAVIKVVGVGGGGGNALNYMVEKNIAGVDFISANTDMQALNDSRAETKIQLGQSITNGLGAGANPEIGREAAHEVSDKLQDELQGSDMVFITAGLGGGTGTGAAPIIAEIARNAGALVVAVVTKPFDFEGKNRMQQANQGADDLSQHADSLITVPNDKLLTVLDQDATMVECFEKANDVLFGAVQGIAELITCEGLINLDFADVKKVMQKMGTAMIGSGSAGGEQRAHEATQKAISNPLLEDMDLQDVCGLLVNVTASSSLKMREYQEINSQITQLAAEDAEIVLGTVIDESMGDELRVTMVATGLNAEAVSAEDPQPETAPLATRTSQNDEDRAGDQQNTLAGAYLTGGYEEFDAPAIERSSSERTPAKRDGQYNDYLDIPTFLRKQID